MADKRKMGHPQSEETKQKIREAEKGRHLTQETKTKISKAMMGNQNAKK
ncbi:MAG: NUMOD3 domain-containing DNA-binding protein [Oscillospiraceae bacterium]